MTLFSQDPEKELTLHEKQADINRKEFDLETERNYQSTIRPKQIEMDEQFMKLLAVGWLSGLLSEYTIDEERTVFGSEPFLKPAFSAENRILIEKKIMDMIKAI